MPRDPGPHLKAEFLADLGGRLREFPDAASPSTRRVEILAVSIGPFDVDLAQHRPAT
jgi:hypothetical protein